MRASKIIGLNPEVGIKDLVVSLVMNHLSRKSHLSFDDLLADLYVHKSFSNGSSKG